MRSSTSSIHILADLRDAGVDTAADVVRRWAAEDPAGIFVRGATFAVPREAASAVDVLPAGWTVVTDPLTRGYWDATLSEAGRTSEAVVVLFAPALPSLEAVGVMANVLEADPMFGTVVAREQCSDGCCLRELAPLESPAVNWLPQEVLAELPAYDVVGEVSGPAMLLRSTIATEFGEIEPPLTSLTATVLHRIASARRCGFRMVAANRAVIRYIDNDCHQITARSLMPPACDVPRLTEYEDDRERGWREFGGSSARAFETLAGRHVKISRGLGRRSLLLDMRNLGATYNGTSFAALGAARGLHRAGIDWDVAILANDEGAQFHDLQSAFPGWTIYTSVPPTGFDVALRLSQPWHIQEMVGLHQAARLNVYLVLDTIAWDVIYVAPPQLDGTWQFLASSADGLLFISDFSMRRFQARFSTPHGSQTVCHLSFDPRDYTRDELRDDSEDDYFLVIGNHLAHKDVAATTDLLASAFPLSPIATLGPAARRLPQVKAHRSGTLSDLDVQRLYARARLAIFPSFYEGFGLPVVAALAYGRTLLARESPLLDEIAAQCVPHGRLITYRRRDQLVDIIGRLTHGMPVEQARLGSALDGRPPRGWQQVGEQIDAYLRTLLTSVGIGQWRERDRAIRQVLAARA